MPTYITFSRKASSLRRREEVPGDKVELMQVDEELCTFLGIPPHPKKWCRYWYNAFSEGLAMLGMIGKLRTCYENTQPSGELEVKHQAEAIKILNWLDDNYYFQAIWRGK